MKQITLLLLIFILCPIYLPIVLLVSIIEIFVFQFIKPKTNSYNRKWSKIIKFFAYPFDEINFYYDDDQVESLFYVLMAWCFVFYIAIGFYFVAIK